MDSEHPNQAMKKEELFLAFLSRTCVSFCVIKISRVYKIRYLALIRRLIKTYTLEPAGSHGVWGLDDHSFLPYLFGSAQYAPVVSSASEIPTEGAREGAPDPADVTKMMTVERERKKNLYFGAIGFIYDVKKGPFWEHSPMLFDISGVRAGWAKINKVWQTPPPIDRLFELKLNPRE